jgi:hypothetical protein
MIYFAIWYMSKLWFAKEEARNNCHFSQQQISCIWFWVTTITAEQQSGQVNIFFTFSFQFAWFIVIWCCESCLTCHTYADECRWATDHDWFWTHEAKMTHCPTIMEYWNQANFTQIDPEDMRHWAVWQLSVGWSMSPVDKSTPYLVVDQPMSCHLNWSFLIKKDLLIACPLTLSKA